jgi:hypothetical protein
MMDANAFLRRMLLVAGISALSMVNVAYAHGGGGKGTGGSSGGGSTSSGASSVAVIPRAVRAGTP